MKTESSKTLYIKLPGKKKCKKKNVKMKRERFTDYTKHGLFNHSGQTWIEIRPVC